MDRLIVRWPLVIAVLLVLAVAFGVCVASSRQELAAMEQAAQQASQQLMLTQEKITELKLQLRQVGSSSFIENAARKYYSYQLADELRFEITNPEYLKGYTREEMQLRMEELLE